MSQLFQPLQLSPKPAQTDLHFVVDRFLPSGYLTILAGEPKSGKTALATALALAVATGQPFLGHPTDQGPVLWLSLEESPDERAALLRDLPAKIRQQAQDQPPKGMEPGCLPIYMVYDHAPIDTQLGIAALEHACHVLKPKLIVIDSLHASHSGRSLGDAWSARRTLKGLKRFAGPHAPAILVLHHIGGSRYHRRVAESAQLAATASMFWLLEELPIESLHSPINPLTYSPNPPLTHLPSAPRLYHLQCRGRGGFANRRTQILSRSPLEYETYEPEPTPIPAPNPKNPLDAMVLDALKGKPLTATEVAERIKQNPGSIRNVLTRLQKAGKIRVTAIISGRNKYKTVALNVDDLDDFDDLDDALNSTRTKSPPPLAGGGGSAKRPPVEGF